MPNDVLCLLSNDKGPFPTIEQLLALDDACQAKAGMSLLRPEARLVLNVIRGAPLSIKDAMAGTGASYRGFYDILNRLVGLNILRVERDGRDKRVRRIVPGPAFNSPD